MASKINIVITTGDHDGIGWEVTAKALNKIGPQKNIQFVVFRSELLKREKFKIAPKFKAVSVSNLSEISQYPSAPLITIHSTQSPARWVEQAATACMAKEFSAMVTGPLSKTTIQAAGFKEIGHTEILARIAQKKSLFMGFLGKKFSVAIASGHRSLIEAAQGLNAEILKAALIAADDLRKLQSGAKRKKPIALVGLNPHAGEGGLIGQEELWFRSTILELEPQLGKIAGVLVPDAAFLPSEWDKYSVYVCPYHDQGLIPFKMVHGFSGGTHITLGLPFIRTSVDHGTAKNLFGKNKADAGSMVDAIQTAIRLCKEKSK